MKSHMRSRFGTTILHFTLLLTPSSYTVHTCEDARTRTKPTCHIWPLWNSNPKAGVCQVCSSWNTLTEARWMQSILIVPKCPHRHSIITNLKQDQMRLWHKTVGAALFWWETEPSRSQQVGESGCQTLAPVSDPALLLGLKSGLRMLSLQEVITSNTWELSCVILVKMWY